MKLSNNVLSIDTKVQNSKVADILSQRMPEEGVFNRIEDKFIIKRDEQEALDELINKYAEPSYPSSDTEYTLIESLYFDSPDFIFFQHHFDKSLEHRFKLRVRRYAPNGNWASTGAYLLEVKKKKNNICKKKRIKISDTTLNELKRGLPVRITDELIEINRKLTLETLSKRVLQINMLILEYKLKPMIRVRYHRKAYVSDGIRITVDSGVTPSLVGSPDFDVASKFSDKPFWASVERILAKYVKRDTQILEIKHVGSFPDWLSRFFASTNKEKQSFSKYCFSTSSIILDSLSGKYVNNENIVRPIDSLLH